VRARVRAGACVRVCVYKAQCNAGMRLALGCPWARGRAGPVPPWGSPALRRFAQSRRDPSFFATVALPIETPPRTRPPQADKPAGVRVPRRAATLGPHWHAPGASSGRLRGNEPGLRASGWPDPDLTSLTRGGIGTEPRPRLGVHSAALTRRGDGRSALMAPGCATARLPCALVRYVASTDGVRSCRIQIGVHLSPT
jgi:hypothetical protein